MRTDLWQVLYIMPVLSRVLTNYYESHSFLWKILVTDGEPVGVVESDTQQ